MKRKFYSLMLMVGLLMAVSVSGMAQNCNRNRNINERQGNERQRITRGVRSGELTRWETARLGREQRSIRVDEREARSDGEFTGAERREIREDLNDASRHIYRAKHNRYERN
ncbi:MAG: hypothetical protein ABI882_20825 [Acidobacteriota bacterium]